MQLTPGTRLGPYEIVAPLGAGGMGEVYKATDTRLDRIVAIKVLPATLAHDPDSRARFEREAKMISQLKHPHICTLYDVGTDPAAPAYLVMEYLEGETLAAGIKKGPVPVEQALEYAIQIAHALDKAHRLGIVHRDLKPGNIMLTKTGATLLDFGLATIAPPVNVTTMETRTTPEQGPGGSGGGPLTSQGTILGTFQYMAPEQVEGQEADARADLWAFGCVLYEMVTARRPFEGKTQASVVGAILEREPTPMAELQPLSPPALGRIVRTCLAKNPDDRFQTAHDLWLQLQWIEEGGSAAGLPAPVIAHRKRRERSIWVAGALALAAIVGTTAWLLKPAPEVTQRRVTRFTFALPEGQQFSNTGRRVVAISPDGSKVAYIANQQIYVRVMSQLTAQPLVGTNETPLDLVFSPDSQWIAYFAAPAGQSTTVTLKKIAVSGGAPVKLAATGWPFGSSWRGGTILFGQNGATMHGIQAVANTGGTPRTVVTVDQKEQAGQPQMLDDGRHVIFTLRPAGAKSWDESDIVVQTIDGGARKSLVHGGTDGRVLPDGSLLYATGGNLLAVGFDARTLALRGGPVPVLEGVQASTATGGGQFALSDAGALVYVPGAVADATALRSLVWVDRQGHEQPISAKPRAYLAPRLSPDGTKVAVSSDDAEHDIWVFDLTKEVLTRLTFGPAYEGSPFWTPDNKYVIFCSRPSSRGPADIFRKAADGTGAAEALTQNGAGGCPKSVSPDGKSLVFTKSPFGKAGLSVLPLGPNGPAHALLADPKFNQYDAKISPDGRWIAYSSDESGPIQIHVRPFPGVESGRWQISSEYDEAPVWSRSGRELFFVSANRLVAVPVQSGSSFTYAKPQRFLICQTITLQPLHVRSGRTTTSPPTAKSS